MFFSKILAVTLMCATPASVSPHPQTALVSHTYEARIRLNGRVSTTQVQASDAGQAKKLVQMQFGPGVTVLSVKKIN